MRFHMVALVCMVMLNSCLADDKMIAPEQLPETAKTFITAQFPDNPVLLAQKDADFTKTKYEVTLKDGTEIDFDKKGEWDKVDCKMNAIPAALLPQAIATYVETNFPDMVVVKIDKERNGYEIKLSNDLDLTFNASGMLIEMDD